MRELLDRLTANIHWIVFLLLETFSGFMLFQFNHYQGSVWFTGANSVAASVMELEAEFLQYLHLSDENRSLTRENLLLQQEMDSLRHVIADLRKKETYTEKLQNELLQDYELIPAHVISNSVCQKDNFIIIDVGLADGVQPEMGVVSGTGVVGIVSKVNAHHALVMSVLNSQSSISCRIRGSEYFGYMKWKGGSPLRTFMDDVPHHAKIQKGNIVETSGFSSVFPAGIFLGKVENIRNSSDGLAFQLEIMMSTDLSCIRNVSVIKFSDPPNF